MHNYAYLTVWNKYKINTPESDYKVQLLSNHDWILQWDWPISSKVESKHKGHSTLLFLICINICLTLMNTLIICCLQNNDLCEIFTLYKLGGWRLYDVSKDNVCIEYVVHLSMWNPYESSDSAVFVCIC